VSLGAAFVRVSTGSQDETSQVKIIEADAQERGITIVKTFKLHGYSASHGTQEPALREAIADIERGDYSTLIVTESSRLDRREDPTAAHPHARDPYLRTELWGGRLRFAGSEFATEQAGYLEGALIDAARVATQLTEGTPGHFVEAGHLEESRRGINL